MRFTITRENLQHGLAAVGASIPTRTTLPVLSNILIEAEGEGARMSGTDLDIGVSVFAPAEVEAPGSLTVPAKKLQELARELPEQPARVTVQGDRLDLECGRASFRLNGLPRDEFPAFPTVDFGSSWQIPGDVLHSLIRQTSFAASTEESRPILNGVLWQLGAGEMRMVATNGHRLARMIVPAKTPDVPTADLIVPPKALEQVQRLFPAGREVEVARSENHLGFRDGRTQVFTRLIEGPYPNYDKVIPRGDERVAVVDRAAFIAALRRMAVVASEQTHRVRLSLAPGGVRFAVATPDLGEANEELEIDYRGEPLEIGFNAAYLLEVLRYVPTGEIRMAFNGQEGATRIQPLAGEDQGVADFLYLVMPLRVRE